jgi:hypothetical protein
MSIGPEESVQIAINRRLSRALMDLGLDGVLPTNWLSFHDGSCHFSPISFKALTRLVANLEDVSQLEPYEHEVVFETVEPKTIDDDNLTALVEYREYQSIPVGFHAPQLKIC